MSRELMALRALVDLRDRQLQKARVQFGNRLYAVMVQDDPSVEVQRKIVQRYHDAFSHLEEMAEKDIAQLAARLPICRELAAVRGVGPILAAKLVALIGDIGSFDTVSKLWRFAGFAVVDGKAERLKAGEPAHYSVRLKTTMYLVGVSFLRQNSPYRVIYDQAKARYEQARPEWTPTHRHLAALRVMVKLFLSHLWERWRLLEGLPVRPPYALEYLQHHTYLEPKRFGWKAASIPADGWTGMSEFE